MRHRYEIEGQPHFKEVACALIENELTYTNYLGGLKLIVVEPITRDVEKAERIISAFENKMSINRYVNFHSKWYKVDQFCFDPEKSPMNAYNLLERMRRGEGTNR